MRIVSSSGRKRPSTEPAGDRLPNEPLEFHEPTRGRCTCTGCTEALVDGPLCQSCHEPWRAYLAPDVRGDLVAKVQQLLIDHHT